MTFLEARPHDLDMVLGAAGGLVAIGFILVVVVYFLPSIIGYMRKVPNIGSVFVINFFLGWSLIGWVVALAMAARSVPPR